jgi:glycosyltransferase involved in cell wall biosynthesis
MPSPVSVIMPAHNAGRYIEEAAASVKAQTWPDLELIVCDDGSTDDTPPRLAAIRGTWGGPGRGMTVIRQDNAGAGAARNTALAAATGEVVVFMDADDRLHPDLVARLVGRLRAEAGADLVFPDHRYIDAAGAEIGHCSRARSDRFDAIDLMIENPIHSATGVAVRRRAVDLASGFDPALPACIDLDLFVRIGLQRPGNIVAAREVLADYRKRDGQITSDWRRMRRGWTTVAGKLAEAGRPLTRDERRRARAPQSLYWSSIAYEAGDHAAARRLIATVWLRDPRYAARSPLARIRTLSCLASFLPRPVHHCLRDGFNRRPGSGRDRSSGVTGGRS